MAYLILFLLVSVAFLSGVVVGMFVPFKFDSGRWDDQGLETGDDIRQTMLLRDMESKRGKL